MASVGSFGVTEDTGDPSYQQTKSRNQTAETSLLLNNKGRKLEGTTHGSEIRKSQEFFAGATLPTDAELQAVDGQNGTDLIVGDAVNEQSSEYARETIETQILPGAEA